MVKIAPHWLIVTSDIIFAITAILVTAWAFWDVAGLIANWLDNRSGNN